jgi:hypothetical protein
MEVVSGVESYYLILHIVFLLIAASVLINVIYVNF